MVSADVLERFPIFSALDEQTLQNAAQACSVHTYNASELVFSEGRPAKHFYMLSSGRISIERRLSQSWLRVEGITDVVVHMVRESEVFGWSSLVEPGILTASARCVETSEVITIEREKLLQILESSTGAGYLFMRRLASIITSRLTETAERLMNQTVEAETYRVM